MENNLVTWETVFELCSRSPIRLDVTRSRLLFQLSCQFVRYSVVFVIAVFVMFSPTQWYIFLNFLLLDCRNMANFLFALVLFLSDVWPLTWQCRCRQSYLCTCGFGFTGPQQPCTRCVAASPRLPVPTLHERRAVVF